MGPLDGRILGIPIAAHEESSGLATQETNPTSESPSGPAAIAPKQVAHPAGSAETSVAETQTATLPGEPAMAPLPLAASTPAPSGTLLREETALLETVRASLARSNAANALAALARYDARFPSGMLGDEASILRVEALMAAGRRDEARQSAERFKERHPESTYASRMRVLLGR